jgi:DNA-binding FrmR family transcriptional regulator
MQADKERAVRLLKTARGQLDGLLKMIEEDRACMDVSYQLLATQAILRKVNHDVIRAHLQGCVREAFQTGQEAEKIEEVLAIVDKLTG